MDDKYDKWVVLHRRHHIFLRGFRACDEEVFPSWTLYLKRARAFPSESAANAVIEEWGLKGVAEPCVICTSES